MQPQEVAGAARVVRHSPGLPHSRSRWFPGCGCLGDARGCMPQAAAMRQEALAALRLLLQEAGGCTAEGRSTLPLTGSSLTVSRAPDTFATCWMAAVSLYSWTTSPSPTPCRVSPTHGQHANAASSVMWQPNCRCCQRGQR
jgi:hypothetical protein